MINVVPNQWTDLLWYLSVVGGLGMFVWRAERAGLDARDAFLAGLFGLLGGMLGGSVMASGGPPPGVSASPATWAQFVYAEKGVFGVVLGGVLLAAPWLVARGLSVLRFADAAAPAVALAYVVARLDCFTHGHCFGIPADLPWAVTFPAGTQAFIAQTAAGLIAPGSATTLPVHPTQLYHALLGLVGLVVLLRARRVAPGASLALAMMLYGVGRFAIQFYRGDAVPILGPLDFNHFASLATAVAGLLLWRYRPVAITVAPQGQPI